MSLTKGRCAAPGGVVGAHRHPPPPLPLRTRHQRPRLRRPAADNDDPAAALNQVSDILRKYGSGGSAGEVQSAGLQGECSGRAASAPGGHLRPELLAWAGQGKTLRAHGRVLHAAFYRRACCSCPVISREPSHHTLHALLPAALQAPHPSRRHRGGRRRRRRSSRSSPPATAAWETASSSSFLYVVEACSGGRGSEGAGAGSCCTGRARRPGPASRDAAERH